MKFRQYAALGLAVVAPMGLSGCLLLPGEFTSEMVLNKSGEFSFSYKGQIQLVALANLLNDDLNKEAGSNEFEPNCFGPEPEEKTPAEEKKEKKKAKAKERAQMEDSRTDAALRSIANHDSGTAASKTAQYDDDLAMQGTEDEAAADSKAKDDAATDGDAADAAKEAAAAADEAAEAEEAAFATEADDYEERECTDKEIEEQKKEWTEQQERQKKEKEQAKKMFAMMLGGIDPENPKSIDQFTREVERLAAWNSVKHIGKGVFQIDYSTKGKLADDFAFPIIPRYSLGNPMVHITRWDNGRVRVEAPSFHNDPDMSTAALLAGGGMMGGMMGGSRGADIDPIEIKGSFTLKTDAPILANNTDEGPSDEGSMQVLSWTIGPRTFGPPMALLKIAK